jgi:hypothetical protein
VPIESSKVCSGTRYCRRNRRLYRAPLSKQKMKIVKVDSGNHNWRAGRGTASACQSLKAKKYTSPGFRYSSDAYPPPIIKRKTPLQPRIRFLYTPGILQMNLPVLKSKPGPQFGFQGRRTPWAGSVRGGNDSRRGSPGGL